MQANEARARAMLAQENQNEADVQNNNTTVVDAEREIEKARSNRQLRTLLLHLLVT